MKVFVSWSGELSKKIALALREWLPFMMEGVEFYVSSEDVGKGARWFADLSRELEDSQFGIVCLTRENLLAPWVLFEAGAVAKSIDQSRLVPLLIDFPSTELAGPLVQFQYSTISMPDMRKLVIGINACRGDQKAADTRIDKLFEKFWPDLERSVSQAIRETVKVATEPRRDQQDILEEVLQVTRGISQAIAKLPDDLRIGNALRQFLETAKQSGEVEHNYVYFSHKDLDSDLIELPKLDPMLRKQIDVLTEKIRKERKRAARALKEPLLGPEAKDGEKEEEG